jgi:tRNA-intron endonuclease
MLEINFNPRLGIWAETPESVEKLRRNWFGEVRKGKVWLEPEEALYLVNLQKAVCRTAGRELGFNQLAEHFIPKVPRLFIRYNAYRDWRDRGLVVKPFTEAKGSMKRSHKKYPSKALRIGKLGASAVWYPGSMFSVIEDEDKGRELFETRWLGQFGIYKQTRGSLLKLNFLETVFLAKHAGLKVLDSKGKALTYRSIMSQVTRQREWTKQLYEVYEDWRLKGFVVKTGFKFGSHFRIYFPGASPVGEYTHSKHVLHVFPKEQKLLVSEWARAVRVAHGVKKTFLLAIPKMKRSDFVESSADFLAYRRKKDKEGWVRETPKEKPRYLIAAMAEDEHIGGVELASLLDRANRLGLELVLSITDRETSITYYILKKVVLPGSKHEYYEIEWMKP